MSETRGEGITLGRPAVRECYRVDDLTIDVGAMRVWQGSAEVHLPPLSFELLLLFVRRAPDVVSRDECFQTVWRGVVVGPETLKQRVKLLREALSDSSRRPRYIETVRGRGYRLSPAVMLKDNDPDDWPSRLRSRLRGLLGPGGGRRGPGSLAIGGLLLLTVLSLPRADGAAQSLAAALPDDPAPMAATDACLRPARLPLTRRGTRPGGCD
jgi:DNA-binding winged helix-turn-helix (wHTH) protein